MRRPFPEAFSAVRSGARARRNPDFPLIDRPIRPLFPKKYTFEHRSIATVMSWTTKRTDVVALTGHQPPCQSFPCLFRDLLQPCALDASTGIRHQSQFQAAARQRHERRVAGTREQSSWSKAGLVLFRRRTSPRRSISGIRPSCPIPGCPGRTEAPRGTVKEAPPVIETDQAWSTRLRLASKRCATSFYRG